MLDVAPGTYTAYVTRGYEYAPVEASLVVPEGGVATLAAARDPLGVRRLVLVDAVGMTGDWIEGLHPAALARLTGREQALLQALDPRLLHDDSPDASNLNPT